MLKPALRHTKRGIVHLSRLTLLFVLVVAGMGAGGILALRYWVLPDVERYHDDIVTAASVAVGRSVIIERIEADWYGLRPRLLFSGVKILDGRGKTALEFPQLRNTIAWTSLFARELRFNSFEVESPDLLVRRDQQGNYFVAGMMSSGETGVQSDGPGADWLLHQSRIVVHNGHVVWQDDKRNAPPLHFEQVEMVIENRGDHHRVALRASPPAALSSRVDLRGDLYGDSLADFSGWRGEVYAELAGLDAVAWKRWFDLPDAVESGQGAIRLWLGLFSGKLRQVDADVDLFDVRAILGTGLAQMDMTRLRGRFGWHQSDEGFEVSASKLSMLMRDGFEIRPTNLLLRLAPKQSYRSASGEVRANAIELDDIGRLLAYFPVDAALKKRLLDFSPQGRVSDLQASWQGDAEHLAQYRVRARFDKVGLKQVGTFPGFSGLSGEVDGSDSDGILRLDSRGLNLHAPGFLSEALAFDLVSGRLDWQRHGRGWDIKLNDVLARNADLDGRVYGSYQLDDGPGVADLTVNLKRFSVQHVARYIPVHAFDPATYRWLQTGLQDGVASSFLMRVRGDLRDFPFPDSKNGLFKLEAKASNVAIEFDPGWPRIEHAATDLLIQGRYLEVRASSGMTGGAALRNAIVVLPDTLSHNLVMSVSGEAADATQRCLDYIRHSPVREYLDGYTDNMKVRGDGLLKLKLDVPLNGQTPPVVVGSYQFFNNHVDIAPQVPLLSFASGMLSFTNDSLLADGIQAQILGGAARLSLKSDNGSLLARASGKLNADKLPVHYTYPLLKRLHGTADWVAEIRVKDKMADVAVDSDLVGLRSDLPPPFAKMATQRIPLRFEQKDITSRQDRFRVSYGDLVNAELTRVANEYEQWNIRRGAILFGATAVKPSADGVVVVGDLPLFVLEGWNGWSDFPSGGGGLPNIAGINVNIDRVVGYGNNVHQLNIRGSGRNGLVSTRITSREVNGDLIWQPQHEGRLLVRLKNAQLGEGEEEAPPVVATASVPGRMSLPSFDVAVDKLSWKGRQLGRLELLLNSRDGDVILDNLRLTNPDGVFNASGKWAYSPQHTELKTRFDITNAGKILARSGYPESLKDGSGVLECDLGWDGAPDEFNYASLKGVLRLQTGKGRFAQVNPGAAKLLGVLSLQALPKRITLDFNDVLSPGFEFERIEGHAQIERSLIKDADFIMTGAAAKITLKGKVDLERETQQLQVRVMPAIGDNVSMLSFVAGPAVGVGVLIANKILSDPLDKLVSFEYNVSGSWSDPKVERAGQTKAAENGTAAGE